MSSMLESKIKRLQREIGQLEKQRANAVKDESDSLKKINSANSSISRTKNVTTIRNKEREIQKENDKIQKAKEKQSNLLSRISRKNLDLNKASSDLSQARQKEQEKLFKQQENSLKEYQQQQQSLLESAAVTETPLTSADEHKEYDVFISHSADDKDDYVKELADLLKSEGINTWYDTDDIPWGSSIRQEIDKGLANSRYGIVIISPTFIEKHWTNYELDGILSKQSRTGTQMILPIWHNVTADTVTKYSPSISNINALNTAFITKADIVENIKKLIK